MAGFAFELGAWAPFFWLLAAGLIGYALLQAVQAGRAAGVKSLTEALFRCTAAGLLSILWSALLLAELGRLRLRWLLGAQLLLVLLSLLWAWRRRASWRLPRPRREDCLALVLLVIVTGLTCRPHLHVLGGEGQGLYLAIAGSLARSESIAAIDPELSALDPQWARQEFFYPSPWAGETTPFGDVLAQARYLEGFILDDQEPGKIVPSFLHMFPAWLALNYKLGGIDGMLQAQFATGLLAVLAVYLAGRALFGRRTAFGGALLLAVNLGFTWLHRTPAPAGLAQPLLFVLLYGLLGHQAGEDRGAEMLAALSLGALLHIQLDALLLLGLVAVWLLWMLARPDGRWGHWRLFLLLAGLQLLHFLVYVRALAWGYVLSTAWALLGGRTLWLSLLLLLLGAGAVVVAVGIRRGWFSKNLRGARLVAVALVGALSLGAYWVSQARLHAGPAYGGWSPAGLFQSLTSWGFALGVGGLLLFLWRGRPAQAFLWLGPFLACLTFYLGCGEQAAEFLNLGPAGAAVVIPVLLLGAAYFIEWIGQLLSGWRSRWVPLLLGGCLLAITAMPSIALAKHVEYLGAVGAVRQLSQEVEPEAILLFFDPAQAQLFAPPLRYLFDRQVFVLQQENPDTAALRDLVEQWEQQGRSAYLITPHGMDRLALRDLVMARQAIFSFHFPQMDLSRGRMQAQAVVRDLTLHRLQALPALTSGQEMVIDVGGDDLAYISRGFYAKESTADGRSFRWTEDQAEIELPGRWFCLPGAPILTLVLSQNFASAQEPAMFALRLEETVLGQIEPPPSWQSVQFPIPETLGPQFCQQDVVLLQLSGPVWSPSWTGKSVDSRLLGLALDQVILTLP